MSIAKMLGRLERLEREAGMGGGVCACTYRAGASGMRVLWDKDDGSGELDPAKSDLVAVCPVCHRPRKTLHIGYVSNWQEQEARSKA